MSVAGMVTSCTSDIDLYDVGVANGQEESEITVHVKPFVVNGTAETRSYFLNIPDGGVFAVQFEKNEEFGICTEDGIKGQYIKLSSENTGTIKKGTGSLTDDEDKLGNSEKYVAFYPREKVTYSNNCFTMNFSNQEQDGYDESGENVASKNNYFVSNICTSTKKGKISGSSPIVLNALNSVFQIKTTLPKGDYSKIELENSNGFKTFYSNASVKIFSDENEDEDEEDEDEEDEEELVDEEYEFFGGYKQSSLSLQLNDLSVTDKKEYVFYIAVYPSNTGKFKVKLTRKDGSVYYSNQEYEFETLKAGCGYVLNCTFNFHKKIPAPDFVDLGLTSGLLWATMNVGANKVTDCGNYYAWAEIEPKDSYTQENYDFYSNGQFYAPYYVINGKKESVLSYDLKNTPYFGTYKERLSAGNAYPPLLEEFDVAKMSYGGTCKMPTNSDWFELYEECYWVWTDSYNGENVRGYIVYKTKKTEDKGLYTYSGDVPLSSYSIDDTHIFLPAAGYASKNQICSKGAYGSYWSSVFCSLDDLKNCATASALGFGPDFHYPSWGAGRYVGRSVRAVMKK